MGCNARRNRVSEKGKAMRPNFATEFKEYAMGFDDGCGFLIHEIQRYLLALPAHEAMVLVRLLGYLTPPTKEEMKRPH